MAINRFHQPILAEYVSQYVPIPFLELFALGKQYNEEREKAEEQYTKHLQSARDFHSLITKDNESYYNTINNANVRAVTEELSRNPDLLKSAAGRQMLNTAINSVNYGNIAKLQASAKQAELYQSAMQKLAIEGKMVPGWEQNYFDTYSTLGTGKVFNAAPLEYSSVEDVAYSYVENLEDSWLGNWGGYNWIGVNEKTALDQVDQHFSEILADPRVNRHREILVASGMTDAEALQEIKNRANTAAMRAVRKKPEADPYFLLSERAKYAGKGKSGKKTEDENKPSDFTVNAQLDTASAYNKGIEEYVSDKFLRELDKNPAAKKMYSDLRMKSFIKGKPMDVDMFDIPEIKNIYDSVRNGRLDAKSMFIDIFNKNAENGKLTAASINSSSRELLDRYSKTIQDAKVSTAAQLALPNKEGKGEFVTTGFGSNIKLINSKNLQLTQSYMFGKTGKSVESMDPVFDKLNKDLRSGKFKDVIVRSANNLIRIPEEYQESSVTCNYTVSIPKSQFSGYTDEELQRIGAIVEKTPDEIRETYRQGNTGQSKTQTIVPGEDYVTIEVTSDIDVDGLNAEYLNAAMHKETLGISASGKLHPDVQYDAYHDDLNDDVLRFLGN